MVLLYGSAINNQFKNSGNVRSFSSLAWSCRGSVHPTFAQYVWTSNGKGPHGRDKGDYRNLIRLVVCLHELRILERQCSFIRMHLQRGFTALRVIHGLKMFFWRLSLPVRAYILERTICYLNIFLITVFCIKDAFHNILKKICPIRAALESVTGCRASYHITSHRRH
jgi:hypothetical protein